MVWVLDLKWQVINLLGIAATITGHSIKRVVACKLVPCSKKIGFHSGSTAQQIEDLR